MPEAPAPDVDKPEEPVVDEGKNPDGETPTDAEEPRGRTYTEAYVKQLRKESADNRNKITELEERLQEVADRDKSELQKISEERDRLLEENRKAQTLQWRIEVAAEHGLGTETLRFLSGSTKEEIELNAEELAKVLKTQAKPTIAGFDGGARKTASEKKSPEEEHNALLLRAMGREPAS